MDKTDQKTSETQKKIFPLLIAVNCKQHASFWGSFAPLLKLLQRSKTVLTDETQR
nr:hypothetical protein [uncultured Cohaesibacter sp.]